MKLSIQQEFISIQKLVTDLPDWVPISLIVIECMLYEWTGVFELAALKSFVMICKIVIPLFLLLLVLPVNSCSSHHKKFICFFAIFMAWGLVSISFSNFFLEGIFQWIKFFFRFIFCVAVCLYFMKRQICHQTIIMKILVIIALATVAQYFILEMFSLTGLTENGINIKTHAGGVYYGPLGILGNGTAQFSFFYAVPKFQLQGFWVEPSHAAGFMFMSSFIAEALYTTTQKKLWMVASGVCCIGGIFTFANAGYFALGFALLIGQIVYFIRGNRNRTLRVVLSRGMGYHFLMATSIFLILFSLFGRYAVIKYIPDSKPLKAITGVRGALLTLIPTPTPIKPVKPVSIDDTMMQRGKLANIAFDRPFIKMIIGDGFRIPGRDSQGRGVTVSASAPIMWLFFTGIVGLILILLRELQVLWSFISGFPPSTYQLRIFQAWIVLVFQNMVYGTWMSPLYFLLIALVFSSLCSNYCTATSVNGINKDG